MNPELQHTLSELAAKLGTTVEKLWPVLVAHARLDAIIGIIGFLGAALAFLVFARYSYKKVIDPDGYDDEIWWLPTILSGVIGIVFIFAFMSCIPDVIYPEVAALHRLVEK